jgi:BirA family biotin operon repressor/biotin-[acetyl-CoA-carboxylase] ligase
LSEFVDHPTPAVVVGMGLNLTASMPERGTDLLAETGHSISAGSILDALLKELDERRPLLDSVSGLTALRSEYLATLSTLGQLVRVERHDGDLIGRAVGVGDAGELLIDSDGVEHAISLGDVIHLRAVQS